MKILQRKTANNSESQKRIEIKLPKVAVISTSKLTYDKTYQRKLDFTHVREISNEFDSDLFGILVVSERDDKYYIVDGLHRYFATRDFISEMPCLLWQGLTYEEECEKFRKLNTARKSLNASQVFHELVCEGDKNALEVVNILKKCGFDYNRDNQITKNNIVGSPKRMLKIYETYGGAALYRLMYINRKAWHGCKEGLTATILVGLNTFLTENLNIDDAYLVKALETTEPTLIKIQASYYINADNVSGVSGGSSRYIHIANAIKAAYNKTVPKSMRIM